MKSESRNSNVEVLSLPAKNSNGREKSVLIERGLMFHKDSTIFHVCAEPFLRGRSSSILSVNPTSPTFILSLHAEKAKTAATFKRSSRFDSSTLANSIERDKSAMMTALNSFSSKSFFMKG